MKQLAAGILGFLCILISHSLTAQLSFSVDLLVYIFILYSVFYLPKFPSYPLLVGVTVGIELLLSTRFGQGSILALVVYGLTLLLGQQLRFTSPFPRYIVALLITMTAYVLLLVSARSFVHYLIPLSLTFVPAVLASYIASNSSRPHRDEFI